MSQVLVQYYLRGVDIPITEVIEGDERTYGEVIEEVERDLVAGVVKVIEPMAHELERTAEEHTRLIPPTAIAFVDVVQVTE